jgi:hypothetical protein
MFGEVLTETFKNSKVLIYVVGWEYGLPPPWRSLVSVVTLLTKEREII